MINPFAAEQESEIKTKTNEKKIIIIDDTWCILTNYGCIMHPWRFFLFFAMRLQFAISRNIEIIIMNASNFEPNQIANRLLSSL